MEVALLLCRSPIFSSPCLPVDFTLRPFVSFVVEVLLHSDCPSLPLVTQRQQSQTKPARRTGRSGYFTRQLECVADEEGCRAKGRCNRVQLAMLKNLWRVSAKHIADRASTHRCGCAQQQRR